MSEAIEGAIEALAVVGSAPKLNPDEALRASFVRRYVRREMVPNLVERLYGTAMGITKFQTPVGFEVKELEAPPQVQTKTALALMAFSYPQRTEGEGGIKLGVIVMPPLGMAEARERADKARLGEGPVAVVEYQRDPSLEYVEIESTPGEVDEYLTRHATPPPEPVARTRAQEILAKRQRKPG